MLARCARSPGGWSWEKFVHLVCVSLGVFVGIVSSGWGDSKDHESNSPWAQNRPIHFAFAYVGVWTKVAERSPKQSAESSEESLQLSLKLF